MFTCFADEIFFIEAEECLDSFASFFFLFLYIIVSFLFATVHPLECTHRFASSLVSCLRKHFLPFLNWEMNLDLALVSTTALHSLPPDITLFQRVYSFSCIFFLSKLAVIFFIYSLYSRQVWLISLFLTFIPHTCLVFSVIRCI